MNVNELVEKLQRCRGSDQVYVQRKVDGIRYEAHTIATVFTYTGSRIAPIVVIALTEEVQCPKV